MNGLLVRNARIGWTGRRELAGADVVCRSGRVVAVGPGVGSSAVAEWLAAMNRTCGEVG